MEKNMDKEKNKLIMGNYYLKENIKMKLNGLEKDMIKMEKFYMN